MSPVLAIPQAQITTSWTWRERRVVVMGLGHFGGTVGAIRWLAGQGAEITVTDLAPPEKLSDACERIADLPVKLALGGHDPRDLDSADLLVVSPAVDKRKSPYFLEAQARGIPWTSEMNLFLERCSATLVGITGSAGKSTVSAMLHAICADAIRNGELSYRSCLLGGNIGKSLLEEAAQLAPEDLVILELSSFQLEDSVGIPWHPKIAVLTNVTPNHLDRHGSFHEYLDAKLNLIRAIRRSRSPDTYDPPSVVMGTSDAEVLKAVSVVAGKANSQVIVAESRSRSYKLKIPGAHNQQNAHLAATVAEILRIPQSTTHRALAEFPGLPHRLQFVMRVDGVDYINDSKATNPQEAMVSLRSFEGPLVVIVGGQDRPGVTLDEFFSLLEERASVVICLGPHARTWSRELCRRSPDSLARPIIQNAANMAAAVLQAAELAVEDYTVLLAPAAPSYDQYRNYEERGEDFVRCVRALPRARIDRPI